MCSVVTSCLSYKSIEWVDENTMLRVILIAEYAVVFNVCVGGNFFLSPPTPPDYGINALIGDWIFAIPEASPTVRIR